MRVRIAMHPPSDRSRQAESACPCATTADASRRVAKWVTVGGLLASLGLCAACCLLPFVLFSMGVAAAWAGRLEALAPYKWLFLLATFALLGYGFYVTHGRVNRSDATAGGGGKMTRSERAVRLGLWIATAMGVSGIVFEQIEPLLRK